MNRLEIFMLGSFKVQLDGVDITHLLRTKKECAILAYLAEESSRAHARETIAEFFWPERPDNYARMNLRQALLGIRKAFSGEENTVPFLGFTENTIQLKPGTAWMDTAAFNQHMQAIKQHTHSHLYECKECIRHLEQAVDSYRGHFLDGLLIGDVASFQEWVVSQRERYYRYMLDALQLVSKAHIKQGSYDKAYLYAWRYVDLAPLEESAYRLLMRLLVLSGRRSAALQQYHACKAIIERELGIEPSAETKQLYEQIMNGQPIQQIDTGSLAIANVPTRPAYHSSEVVAHLYDPATQIPLRPLFMDRLQHALARMERAQLSVIVCVASVTYPLNHDMSPDIKKLVQQNLVRRLVGSVREGDTVSLLADGEFGLILEEIKDPQVLAQIAQKITKVLNAPIIVQGHRIEVKAVIGTSMFPFEGNDPITLLNQADNSMRTARLKQASFFYPSS